MLHISEVPKSPQATWVSKATIDPAGHVEIHPNETAPLPAVEVAWYPDGSIKCTVKGYGPAKLRQFYGTGIDRNVITEITPDN